MKKLLLLIFIITITSCKFNEKRFLEDCCSTPTLQVQAGVGKVFVPNVFTPNFDGVNDILIIHTDRHIAKINFVRIFDFSGSLIYEEEDLSPNDPERSWDGVNDNILVQEDVYTCQLSVKDNNGNDFEFETLIWVRYDRDFPCVENEEECVYGRNHDGAGRVNLTFDTGENCN